MADFHAADLWVAVVPDTSKVGPAMEDAGKQAKDKFGAGAKDIGKGIDDDLTKVGEKAKDTFNKAGREAGTGFGSELKNTVTEQVKGAFSDVASDVRSGNIAGAFEGLKSKVGGISDVAKQVGVDISGWIPPIGQAKGEIDGFDTQVKEGLNSVTGVTSMFEGLPGKIGKAAGAMGEFAMVITTALEISKQLLSTLDKVSVIHDRFMNPDGTPKSSIDDWADQNLPSWLNPNKLDPNYHPRDHSKVNPTPEGQSWYTDKWFFPGEPGPASTVPDLVPQSWWKKGQKWWTGDDRPGRGDSSGGAGASPSPAPEPSARGGGGRGGGASGSGSRTPRPSTPTDRAGLHAAGTQVANLYAFAESLVGTPYSTPLRDDCSGMVHELAAVAVGLPPPSSGQRFSTPTEGDWLLSHGFKMGMGGPGDLRIGWNPAPGMSGHTAATLPGGEHAEQGGSHPGFLIGHGAAGADDPQFSMHAYLPMGGGRGAGGGGRGAGGGGGGGATPVGSQSDPVYTKDTDTAGGSRGDNSYESQGKQLAQGFASGIAELFGLDGSVFKGFGGGGKSPLDFGAVNLFKGFMGAIGGGGSPAGGGGGMSSGLGAAISAAVGGGDSRAAAGLGSAPTINIHGDVAPFNVTQHGVGDNGVQPWQQAANANVPNRYNGLTAMTPGQ